MATNEKRKIRLCRGSGSGMSKGGSGKALPVMSPVIMRRVNGDGLHVLHLNGDSPPLDLLDLLRRSPTRGKPQESWTSRGGFRARRRLRVQ